MYDRKSYVVKFKATEKVRNKTFKIAKEKGITVTELLTNFVLNYKLKDNKGE